MADPVDLLVFSVPGLSARLLREHAAEFPHIGKLAKHSGAALVVPDDASPAQLEAALLTGLLPEFLVSTDTRESRGRPFWQSANVSAHVSTQFPLPVAWRAFAKSPRLEWRTLPALDSSSTIHPPLVVAEQHIADAPADQAVVLLSAWALAGGKVAGQNAHPLDRPVLLARGFEQTKTCMGLLEVAGLLQRALTGERLVDEL
ncbi:MAG: hypothetical protein R3E76_13875 [Planctomycetota bacterium]